MLRRSLLALTFSALVCLAGAGAASGDDGWTPLYNGRDFSGWQVIRGSLEGWQAHPEMISFRGKGGGCLSTEREYSSFVLKFDYRMSPGGNSGVGIRFPKNGWPSTHGFEIQLLDDDHPRYAALDAKSRNGSIYTHMAARVRAHKPAGEWNSIEIRCEGPLIVVCLNGQEIQNLNMKDHPMNYGKGTLPLSDRPLRGLIGFPSHGDPVDFRNILIRELPEK